MLKRSTVAAWNFDTVRAWVGTLVDSRTQLMTEADNTLKHFSDLGTTWTGLAYDAAYDRVAQDHDQVRKLSLEIDELVTVANQEIGSVESHLRVVQGKVADAQALGMTIDDAWKVMDYENVDAETRKAHQDLINSAFWAFENAVSQAAKNISEQAVEIRSAGDLLGSGLDVADADTQAARFGKDDGTALAEAVKAGDQQAIDQILAQMPQPVLTQFELDALARGEEISTMPAGTQDYYKAFFNEAGKDGILGLNEHLLNKERAGDLTAASQRDGLANALLATTNEKVGTNTGSKGAYQNLPPDVQQLLAMRPGENNMDGPLEVGEHYREVSALGELLGQSSPGMEPGHQMGVEMGRQSQDMAAYLDNVKANMGGTMPPGFMDGDKEAMENGAQSLLGVATRNEDTSYSLLTGNDMPPATDPGNGEKPQPFDPEEFRKEVFGHEWNDDGDAASNLLGWIAEDTHKEGPEGDRARETLVELPNYFAPEGNPSDDSESGRNPLKDGVYEKYVEAMNTNPKIADTLAQVMGTNIDSHIDPGVLETGINDFGAPVMTVEDSNRLLFLASQSEGGRLILEVGRQDYETQMLTRALNENPGNPKEWLGINAPELASLDGRYTSAITNALTYQDQQAVDENNAAKQEAWQNRQNAAEIVKSLTLDNLEIPGKSPVGVVANEVVGVIKDEGFDAAMAKWNPEPSEESVVFPEKAQLGAVTQNRVEQQLFQILHEQGRLPEYGLDSKGNQVPFIGSDGQPVDTSELTGPSRVAVNQMFTDLGLQEFVQDYSRDYSGELESGLAVEPGDVEQYITGKAPTK
ncbi:hypothetical protein [Nocardia sp. NPDC024068]|uniref:TPR repeat region-containing protein n=1 Tax=Nocardia sp. NPDC024068 TaxID=3157197 RepID=UPI0033F256E8